jgi:hypothetical protein
MFYNKIMDNKNKKMTGAGNELGKESYFFFISIDNNGL